MKKITLLTAFLFSLVAVSQTTQQKIQSYLDANVARYGITKQDASDWQIESEVPGAGTGITSIHFTQRHQEIPVFNAQSVAWIKNNQVINVVNNFQNNVAARVNTTTPTLTVLQGISAVYAKLGITQTPTFTIAETKNSKSFMLSDGLNEDLVTAKLVYQTMPNNSLKLAWYYQFYTPDGKNLWDLRIDALNGSILEKKDLVISCAFGGNHRYHNHDTHKTEKNFSFVNKAFKASNSSLAAAPAGTYRAIPYNFISPNHNPFELITTEGNALASPNGWHDANTIGGTNSSLRYTYSRGNNVLAQEDADGNNGTGLRAEGGASLNFNFPFVNGVGQTLQPTAYTNAALTNLFYMNNIMHDVWYQYGFTEVAGNFQQNNLGRGGTTSATGDAVFADGQDGWSQTTPTLDNANFATPNDGGRPRMQMFMWTTGAPPTNFIQVNSPAAIAGPRAATTNVFEGTDRIPVPIAPNGITADLALFNNAQLDPTFSGHSACQEVTNAFDLDQKIVLVRRGGCFFSNKVKRAQDAGALAVIMMDSIPNNPQRLSMSSTGILGINIPAVFVTKEIGDVLQAAVEAGTVNVKLEVPADLYLYADGSFDNGVISHEYGHGISNKLIGGPTNSSCMTNYEQMGEGWSDWFSMMMQLKTGATATDNVYIGTYVINEENNVGPGLREFPYTTDMNINPRTLNSSNEPIPADPANTSYRYVVGETWATVMWDLTWAYINKYGYDPNIYTGTGGNNKVMKLALDALKLQACNTASMVSGRDNLFAADQATTGGQDYCMIAEVFRRRGLGLNATSGSANDSGDQVEDFTAFPPGPNCTLAVDYFNNEGMINVSPNPSNGVFNVRINKFSGKVTMQVVDINGRIVLSQTDADFNNEATIDLSAFQSGIYILKVNANNLNYTEKLIKN
jgi:hypothetical protein